ncbi:hypothetical protein [Aerosakkonema funiforme]|uniref:Uncharacterized protein n=1 Tax=Aerosakkonema funiforme FACHB-1375 TaxID=2949571 RepID=A0A926ZJS7_9CYAN|nr:hypothetical protein [Aerosakkonema funiforme]MBD2184974.1 hypothetical protein [Aerosakkonema funiforme FACHB-1375]
MDINRLAVEALFCYFLAATFSQIISFLYRSHYFPYLIYLIGKAFLLIGLLLTAAYLKRKSPPEELTIISGLAITGLWI